ncbi:hypothetical protein [Lachnobacterium bovis]|uniref:DNA (Cytosine-5)-methyltransferase 1 n=1 Tax=Lachnobacterium bovis TaxID=140626 RepID=A0A1H9U6A5_9FIRM|nr:hypothetical protein [Lachnobacterium bovis]SES04852.1 DNA (cytosine-5)-methyltransferase 1 [Lachnobacterium bovis]
MGFLKNYLEIDNRILIIRLPRKAANGHEYIFSEEAIPMIDAYDKPARTMLTSEGSFSRIIHIVKDKATGRIRLLTAEETERIQGFPTGHTVLYGWR